MPKLDHAAYEAAAEGNGGGSIAQMTPGAYVCRIQAVRTEGSTRSGRWTSDEKEYVLFVYDIAEGPHAGRYSDDYFCDAGGRVDPDKDYMHCVYMSFKVKAYGMLKRRLRAITASNPGFDAEAAFEADRWEMFVGKQFGAVLDGEVDTNDRGYDRWRLSVGEVVSVQDVRDGNCREPKVTDNRAKVEAAPASGGAYDDVPFM